MVWVNPPNRVNYTVIPRIRNVQSRESFRCSTLRVPKCSTTIAVAGFRNNLNTANLKGRAVLCPLALSIITSEAHAVTRPGCKCLLQLRLKMCAFTLCFFRWSL